MSRDNQAEDFKPTTGTTTDNQALSGNIWRDMQDSRSEAPSLTKPAPLTIKDNDSAKPTSDFNLTTGTNRGADVLPALELFDSKAPAKPEAVASSEIEVKGSDVSTEKANQQSVSKESGDVSQEASNFKWETQSESLVGNYNGTNK